MLRFGKLIEYDKRGFGKLGSICHSKLRVFCHISKIRSKYPNIQQALDSQPQTARAYYFWYLSQESLKGKQTVEVWTELIDVPNEYFFEFIRGADFRNVLSHPRQPDPWPEFGRIAREIIGDPRLASDDYETIINSPRIANDPLEIIPHLNDKQRLVFADWLQIERQWLDVTKAPPQWLSSGTQILLGPGKYNELHSARETKIKELAQIRVAEIKAANQRGLQHGIGVEPHRSEVDRHGPTAEGATPQYIGAESKYNTGVAFPIHLRPNPALETLRSNWHQFAELLLRHQVRWLYHFTDQSNVDSIMKHGLISWPELSSRDFAPQYRGGDDGSRRRDSAKGQQDYVRLSFVPDHPMMYVAQRDRRIMNPVVLRIDPTIIYRQDTLFSDMNAVDHLASTGSDLHYLAQVQFGIFAQGYRQGQIEGKYYQAEALVHKSIPAIFIDGQPFPLSVVSQLPKPKAPISNKTGVDSDHVSDFYNPY